MIPGSSRISGSSEGAGVVVAPARGTADLEIARTLFREYGQFLGEAVCLPNYDAEIAGLPGKYAPPQGELMLARDGGGAVVGCIALQPLAGGAGEVKRLFVRGAGRGTGAGRALVKAIEAAARRIGYVELRLDTLPRLVPAVTLYRSLGFDYVDRYNDNPNAGVVFLAKRLAPWTIAPARGTADIEAFRALCRDYVDSIRGIALLHLVDQEIAGLPEPYVPPGGDILLARDASGIAIGCAALRSLPEAGAAELKRLYVVPAWRRRGLGRALMAAIFDAARAIGYREIKLDFIPSMAEGHALYRSLGFVEIGRYNENPNPKLVFMSKRLEDN